MIVKATNSIFLTNNIRDYTDIFIRGFVFLKKENQISKQFVFMKYQKIPGRNSKITTTTKLENSVKTLFFYQFIVG